MSPTRHGEALDVQACPLLRLQEQGVCRRVRRPPWPNPSDVRNAARHRHLADDLEIAREEHQLRGPFPNSLAQAKLFPLAGCAGASRQPEAAC